MNEWWRNRETILKNISDTQGVVSLHAILIEGEIREYALVWWHYGSPSLQLLFRSGEVNFDSDK